MCGWLGYCPQATGEDEGRDDPFFGRGAAGELRCISPDYHTFTHSANVSYYCVMLAKELGITSENELNQIAMGALLHDLGKLEIPASILTKPGKLTDWEFDVIKTHPTVGFRQLCQRQDLNHAQLMMVYQHHERLDGTGYPVRIVKDRRGIARSCSFGKDKAIVSDG